LPGKARGRVANGGALPSATWEGAERLCHNKVSDTTARSRRDEWVEVGVFDAVVGEDLRAYDNIIGRGGNRQEPPLTGPSSGGRWWVLTDEHGIPLGCIGDGANRNDSILLDPTLTAGRRPRSA